MQCALFPSKPITIDSFAIMLVKRIISSDLDDEVDAGVVAAKGVGGDAGEERGVLPLGALDADGGEHAVGVGLLADGVARVDVGVQPLVVHVPQHADRLLALRLALQHRVLADQRRLRSLLDLERRRS